jgi:hypothetical protein
MRYVVLLVCSCVAFAQSPGKPGVTDPIKDPRQIPGHENPGPVPRSTPQPRAANDESGRSRKKVKKTKKRSTKATQTAPARTPEK